MCCRTLWIQTGLRERRECTGSRLSFAQQWDRPFVFRYRSWGTTRLSKLREINLSERVFCFIFSRRKKFCASNLTELTLACTWRLSNLLYVENIGFKVSFIIIIIVNCLPYTTVVGEWVGGKCTLYCYLCSILLHAKTVRFLACTSFLETCRYQVLILATRIKISVKSYVASWSKFAWLDFLLCISPKWALAWSANLQVKDDRHYSLERTAGQPALLGIKRGFH